MLKFAVWAEENFERLRSSENTPTVFFIPNVTSNSCSFDI